MRKMIIGLIVGILIGTTGTALATNETVQATFQKFNIKIGDQEPIEIEALVHEGRSHYHIRIIADLLGEEVDFDDETRTIILSEKQRIGATNESGDEMIDIEEYNLEYIESEIERRILGIETTKSAIRLSNLNRETNPDLPPDPRVPEMERLLEQYEQELEYWRDLKAQKEAQNESVTTE